jgi:ribosome-binding protein aMBF1 (putative translation factor)
LKSAQKSIFTQKYNRFRELIIRARKTANLKQADLAKKLKKPQSFISKYERGERRLDIVEFLEVTKAIGINPHTIIDELTQNQFNKRKQGEPHE